MLLSHRLDDILRRLRDEGRVSVSELAAGMQVVEETIRRDLRLLESRGQLRRIHGGAMALRQGQNQDEPLSERDKVNVRKKAKVALLAERLIGDGMAIFLDTGTTTLALARRLAGRRLRVTTNSLDIAVALRDKEVQVSVAPGLLRSNDNALIGFDTLQYARERAYDMCFMGIGACHHEQGWMDYNESESALRRVLAGQSRQAVLLADSSKFGRTAYVRTFGLGEVKCVVSDRLPAKELLEQFNDQGVRLLTD